MMRSRFAALFLLLATGCGSENALVGARCKDGLEAVDGKCVSTSPPSTFAGNVPRGASDDPRAVVGSMPGSMPLPAPEVGPTTITPPSIVPTTAPTTNTSPELTPPFPLVCAPSLTLCRGVCVDEASDGDNCGACGKICPSNICVNGECQGATPGDVVAIGHDFASTWIGAAQGKVLVNALSIPTTDPIRVLTLEAGGAPASVAQANAIIVAGVAPRKVAFTIATAQSIDSMTLNLSYDVVLIHDVDTADPVGLGQRFAAPLARFTEKGGVVVALDGGFGRMPELVSSAGLVGMTGHTMLPLDTHVAVTAPSDAVGVQVISPYAGPGVSMSFAGVALGGDVTAVVRPIVGSGFGDPIVVHRIVR